MYLFAYFQILIVKLDIIKQKKSDSYELSDSPTNWFCGQRWIRTTEGVSQQIYSLPHLATLVFAHSLLINFPY